MDGAQACSCRQPASQLPPALLHLPHLTPLYPALAPAGTWSSACRPAWRVRRSWRPQTPTLWLAPMWRGRRMCVGMGGPRASSVGAAPYQRCGRPTLPPQPTILQPTAAAPLPGPDTGRVRGAPAPAAAARPGQAEGGVSCLSGEALERPTWCRRRAGLAPAGRSAACCRNALQELQLPSARLETAVVLMEAHECGQGAQASDSAWAGARWRRHWRRRWRRC